MPTVGWVQESATDRYYEGRLTSRGVDLSPQFFCRECSAAFFSIAERDRHELVHPVANPVLKILGREVIGGTFRLTDAVAPDDIELAFVEQVRVNDVVLSTPSELAHVICETPRGFFDIELLRQGQPAKKLKLDLCHVSEAQLQAVDDSFVRCFASELIDGNAISRFKQETDSYSDALWYKEGLVQYLLGVLAKDHRTEQLTYGEFNECFNRALQNLQPYNTPLANSLIRLIEFNANDFSVGRGTQIPLLDVAFALFRGESHQEVRHDGKLNNVLPVDQTTSEILNDLVPHFSVYTLNELERRTRVINPRSSSLQDRQKLHYLCYRKALAEGDVIAKKAYARKLKHDDVFSHMVQESEEIE